MKAYHPAADGRGNDGRNCCGPRRSGILSAAGAGRGKQYTGASLVLNVVSPFESMVPGRVGKSLVTPQTRSLASGGDPD